MFRADAAASFPPAAYKGLPKVATSMGSMGAGITGLSRVCVTWAVADLPWTGTLLFVLRRRPGAIWCDLF